MFKLKYCNINNFGDQLNVEILNHYNIPYLVENDGDGNLLLCGSILESCPDKPDTVVAGVGFMFEDSSAYYNYAKVLAVRGKLSANRIKTQHVKNLFDPGILASKLYPKEKKEYKLGIVPHFVDFDHPDLEKLKKDKHVNVINVRQSPKIVCTEISKCEYVVSSSLHGIIVAESYDIPASWWELSDKVYGNGFKFRDYVSAYRDDELKIYKKHGNNVSTIDLIKSCKRARKGIKEKIMEAESVMKLLKTEHNKRRSTLRIFFTPFMRRIYYNLKKIGYAH